MARRSVRAGLGNWRAYDGTIGDKLRLALRNNAIKLRTVQGCCGNHGEPGCCSASGSHAHDEHGGHRSH